MSGYDELLGKGAGQEEVAAQPEPVIAPEPTPQPEPAPQPEPPGEPVSAAPPAPVAQEPAAPAAPPAARQRAEVPLEALLNEREARKAAAAQAAELQRRLDEIERQNAEAKAKLPDPLVNPEEFVLGLREEVQRTVADVEWRAEEKVIAANETFSRRYWAKELGPERWHSMNEWIAAQAPEFKEQLRRQDDPYAVAAHYWKRATLIERFRDKDPEAWLEEEVARRLAAQAPVSPPPAPAPAQSPPAAPPAQTRRTAPSLAEVTGTAPSAADEPPSGYDRLFKR